jgi:hypothetical protein
MMNSAHDSELDSSHLGSASILQPTADDRATEFSAISGQTSDHYNGYTLMVSAYAAIWVIMMVWLAFLWRKQADINTRIDGLEGALVRAERQVAGKAKGDVASSEKKKGEPETSKSAG